MKTAIVAAALLCLTVFGSSADTLYPAALTFEPGYANGPPAGFPWSEPPNYGDPITIVGRVSAVAPPLQDLLPAGAFELTYVLEGFSCTEWGMWDDIPCTGGLYGLFQNGTLACYLDATPDADFVNPATFRDGDLVLLAACSHLPVTDDDPYENCPMVPDRPDVRGWLTFVGGAWFSHVSDQGTGFTGMMYGELGRTVPMPILLQALGYIFQIDGTVDVNAPVAVTPATWGRVKALYR